MRSLLELRDRIKLLYNRNEVFITPVLKFMLAFVAISTVSGQLGYMQKIDNVGITLILSLMCSFLPVGFIVLFAGLVTMLHLYALSLEVLLAVFIIYFIIFLLFFRFAPNDSIMLLFTSVLMALKIPYMMPVIVGLVCNPVAILPVGCGVVIYYLLDNIAENATAIYAMSSAEGMAKIRLTLDGILGNEAMMVTIVAFSITIIVVYILRRMSVDYSWTIASIAGVVVNLMILLVGDLMFDTNIRFLGAFLGSVLAIIAAKVTEFMKFCVDYNRTENVQFEDDDYYYYVKAVPKMTVAGQQKTVKHINTSRRPAMPREEEEDYRPQRPQRTVTTVRTAPPKPQGTATSGYRRDHLQGAKSVTIGHSTMSHEDEFEDLD